MPTSDILVAGAVLLARFILPLFIPKFPLPAVIACLILDGVDQTIFQQFTSMNLDWYQSYDKALDVYYLVIAYLSTLRNWRSQWAFKVGRFLIYYRLIGVVLFELLDNRTLLLIFPNTFEYFFIFYEAVRIRWNPQRFPDRMWTIAAAVIWIVIKLPQEYWIHVAQRDVTDTVRDLAQNQPWTLVLIGLVIVAAVLVVWFAVIPRLPKPHHGWQFAADPLPRRADTPEERRELVASTRRPFDRVVLEKIALVALVSIIFAQILPGYTGTNVQLAFGVAIIVGLNSAISYWFARKGFGWQSAIKQFFALLLINWLIVVAGNLLTGASLLGAGPGGFLLLLLTLLITLYDYFRPVYTARFELRGTGGKVATATR